LILSVQPLADGDLQCVPQLVVAQHSGGAFSAMLRRQGVLVSIGWD
jgi:hypothetical protein